MSKPRLITLIAIIFGTALLRLIPHPYNFAPITAIALFGGAHFSDKRLAYVVTLGAMFLSDLILGWHSQLIVVYGSFALVVAIGQWLRDHKNAGSTLCSAVAGSVVFFVITNFSVWLFDGLYPRTLNGLVNCYAAAIPFFHNALAGDLMYTVIFFGGFFLAENRFPVLKDSPLALAK